MQVDETSSEGRGGGGGRWTRELEVEVGLTEGVGDVVRTCVNGQVQSTHQSTASNTASRDGACYVVRSSGWGKQRSASGRSRARWQRVVIGKRKPPVAIVVRCAVSAALHTDIAERIADICVDWAVVDVGWRKWLRTTRKLCETGEKEVLTVDVLNCPAAAKSRPCCCHFGSSATERSMPTSAICVEMVRG